MVLVHLGEDLVHTLLRGQPVLVHAHHDHSAHHLIDGLKNVTGKSVYILSQNVQITEYLFLKCNSFSGIQYLMLSPFLTITYLDDLKHFHACDLSIPIQIIHIEGPVEFLLEAASGGDGQRTDELPEVDGPVTILVKCPKGVLRKLRGITIWEKLESER